MNMYNMLHGKNKSSDFLLSMLGLTEADCGRFRDCFLQEDEGQDPKIVIYTRNGGGNRDEYQDTIDQLATHKNYLKDYDDDFDCTYASIEFSVPDQFKATVALLYNEQDKRTPKEKWEHVLKGLEQGKLDDPAVQNAMQVGKAIIDKINGQS